jgi:hypothetical protein
MFSNEETVEYIKSVVFLVLGLIQNSNYCMMNCVKRSSRRTGYREKRSWLLQRNTHWNRILV